MQALYIFLVAQARVFSVPCCVLHLTVISGPPERPALKAALDHAILRAYTKFDLYLGRVESIARKALRGELARLLTETQVGLTRAC